MVPHDIGISEGVNLEMEPVVGEDLPALVGALRMVHNQAFLSQAF